MAVRAPFARVAQFDKDAIDRDAEKLERNIQRKFFADDQAPARDLFELAGVFTDNFRVSYGQLARVDTTAKSIVVLLPRPDDPAADVIQIANVAGTGATTLLPVSGTFVNSTTSYSLSANRGAVTLYPDRIAKNWIVVSGSVGPATQTAAGTMSAIDKTKLDTLIIGPPVTISIPTGAGSADVVAYTVPTTPTGTDRFVLTEFDVRTAGIAPGDTGLVKFRVGSVPGGNDYMTDQTVVATGPNGIIGGLQIASLGSGMPAAYGYEGRLAAGATVNLRATVATGSVSVGKTATIQVFGRLIS